MSTRRRVWSVQADTSARTRSFKGTWSGSKLWRASSERSDRTRSSVPFYLLHGSERFTLALSVDILFAGISRIDLIIRSSFSMEKDTFNLHPKFNQPREEREHCPRHLIAWMRSVSVAVIHHRVTVATFTPPHFHVCRADGLMSMSRARHAVVCPTRQSSTVRRAGCDSRCSRSRHPRRTQRTLRANQQTTGLQSSASFPFADSVSLATATPPTSCHERFLSTLRGGTGSRESRQRVCVRGCPER